MKKVLMTLLVGTLQVFAENTEQEGSSCWVNWKNSVMAYWNGLSEMHKMIVYALLIVTAVWIVSRVIKCGGCGCGCQGNCTCHK